MKKMLRATVFRKARSLGAPSIRIVSGGSQPCPKDNQPVRMLVANSDAAHPAVATLPGENMVALT